MRPPVFPSEAKRRSDDDDRARPAVEPRSWAPTDRKKQARLYTHNTERFTPRPVVEEPDILADEDAEPDLRPPPAWMLVLAVAAIAILVGVLLGGVDLDF